MIEGAVPMATGKFQVLRLDRVVMIDLSIIDEHHCPIFWGRGNLIGVLLKDDLVVEFWQGNVEEEVLWSKGVRLRKKLGELTQETHPSPPSPPQKKSNGPKPLKAFPAPPVTACQARAPLASFPSHTSSAVCSAHSSQPFQGTCPECRSGMCRLPQYWATKRAVSCRFSSSW